jgi:hypothetical protein
MAKMRGVVLGSEHWVIDKTVTRSYRNCITGKYKATRHIKLTCGHSKKLSAWKHEIPLRTHCQECKR